MTLRLQMAAKEQLVQNRPCVQNLSLTHQVRIKRPKLAAQEKHHPCTTLSSTILWPKRKKAWLPCHEGQESTMLSAWFLNCFFIMLILFLAVCIERKPCTTLSIDWCKIFACMDAPGACAKLAWNVMHRDFWRSSWPPLAHERTSMIDASDWWEDHARHPWGVHVVLTPPQCWSHAIQALMLKGSNDCTKTDYLMMFAAELHQKNGHLCVC